MPADLKHDAFEYYGLGNGKPTKLEIVREAGGPQSATRTVQPGKVENGKATFILHQEGALSSEGDITLSLESDGVYAMSSSINKLKPHSLEMPSKLEVGGGWKDHTEMTQAAQNIVLDNDLKIVAKERVSTPGGTFDEALHVTSTGKGHLRATSRSALNTQHWYVRGVGPVKQIVEVRSRTGASRRSRCNSPIPKKGRGLRVFPRRISSTLGGLPGDAPRHARPRPGPATAADFFPARPRRPAGLRGEEAGGTTTLARRGGRRRRSSSTARPRSRWSRKTSSTRSSVRPTTASTARPVLTVGYGEVRTSEPRKDERPGRLYASPSSRPTP